MSEKEITITVELPEGFEEWMADVRTSARQNYDFDADTISPLGWVGWYVNGDTPDEAVREELSWQES